MTKLNITLGAKPTTIVKPTPKSITPAAAIKASLQEKNEPTIPPTDNLLLDSSDAILSPSSSIKERLEIIEGYLAEDKLPIPRLKAGLKDVMTCIKNAGDDIMELQPSDIRSIVQGYIQLASEETQRIVQGKAKKETATKKKAGARAVSATLAKAKDLDIDEVEL